MNLSQILRLCLSEPFDPKKADPGLLRLLARAADVPDFATLDAHLAETQTQVRRRFERLAGSRLRRSGCDLTFARAVGGQADLNHCPDARCGADTHAAAMQLDQ